jgi:hypothetical protein
MPKTKEDECKHENQSGRFCNECGVEVQSEDDRERGYFKDIFHEVMDERGLGKRTAPAAKPRESLMDRIKKSGKK